LRSLADTYATPNPRANGLTPEFLLTAACCRWPQSASRDAAVRSAAANIGDWNEFLRIVKRQRVAGIIHDALLSAGVDCPATITSEIAERARRVSRRNLNFLAETVRLQRALEAAGIAVLTLKGVALAQLAYGSLAVKDTRDIDLLIAPDRVDAALVVLDHEGYALSFPAERLTEAQRRAVFRYAREVQLVRRGGKSRVELQWRAAINPLLLTGVDAHSATQDVPLGDGISIRTLAPDDLFAYLCVHGAQHAWSRLKWLADLNALVSANGTDIAALYRHAQRIGAGICAAQALLLCHRLLDLTLPAGLLGEIERDRRSAKLVDIALRTMADPHAEAETPRGFVGKLRVTRAQFLLGRGLTFFATEWRTASVRILDLVDLPLPPVLHFLYPALRLPLWFWRRTVATRRDGLRPER
jgi:hypothetical protein